MQNSWLFQNKVFDEALIQDFVGFIYLITNIKSGRMYVGKRINT